MSHLTPGTLLLSAPAFVQCQTAPSCSLHPPGRGLPLPASPYLPRRSDCPHRGGRERDRSEMAADQGSCGALTAAVCMVIGIATMGLLRAQEGRIPSESRLDYFPDQGWLRETVQWDAQHMRFLVSHMEGGIGQIAYTPAQSSAPAHEQTLVPRNFNLPFSGLSTNGFKIDYTRNRIVSAMADLLKNKFSAVAAYDISTWDLIFFLKLAGSERASLADDVAIDEGGNIYVTDALGGLIWKVTPDGSNFEEMTAKGAFSVKPRSRLLSFVSVNGIVYHPEGFLIVGHTGGDCLFKVSLDGQYVRRVDLEGTLFGDGIALVSPIQLAVAGLWTGVRLVQSSDLWLTANVTHIYASPCHRLATSVTVKDQDVFVNYLIGQGIPYYSTIGRAVFTPVASSFTM
ncbi:hypothetical protein GOP47_0019432 [Adiantum capillus-veneris]|uniref:Uncharacterized protein n=1 Tax=Adiantum capillus-veneris TaxID=13818 RepID=A0A9D4UBT9_ADICA|nr:hypothetical protein GOP47_0019432 [Adiantum capillus-veneris]